MVKQTGGELNSFGITKPRNIFHSENVQCVHFSIRFLIILFLVYSGFPTATLCVTHHSSLIMLFDSSYWNGLQMRRACKFCTKVKVIIIVLLSTWRQPQPFESGPVCSRHMLITSAYSSAIFLQGPLNRDFYKTR